MTRIRRGIVVTLVVAAAVWANALPSAAALGAEAATLSGGLKVAQGNAGSVSCSFASASIAPGAAKANGKCVDVVTHKQVPSQITSVQRVTGLGGTLCSVSPTTGVGGIAKFAPADPSMANVTFTIRPKSGKGKTAVKSVLYESNDGSNVCGFRPRIVSTPASSAQDKCTWGSGSTFSGAAFYVGKVIECPAAWQCEWVVGLNVKSGGYTYWTTGEVRCSGKDQKGNNRQGYRVFIRNNVYFGNFDPDPAKRHTCRVPLSDGLENVTAFAVPAEWKGFVYWVPDLLSEYPKGQMASSPEDTDPTFKSQPKAFQEGWKGSIC